MKPSDIKFYPLPNGEFVVSYWDSLRRTRIQKTFADELKATEIYNELRMQKPLKESKRLLKDFSIEELIHIYLQEIPEATLGKSPQLIKDFLDQFAVYRCDQIDEIAMRCFFQRQKMEYGYTAYSLSTRKYQIQGLFKWMVSRGLIQDSPQSKIRLGRSRVYRRPRIWVKPPDIKKLICGAALRSPGFLYPMLLLVTEGAAKTIDLLELKWRDLDLKSGKVIFQEREKIQRREIQLSKTCVDVIKRVDQISDHIFTNLEGRPLRQEILVRELRQLKKQIGHGGDWVFRDLRHSFAVNFLKSGGDIKVLQKILGHGHLRMTEELYGQYKTQFADFFDLEVVPGTEVSASENDEFREF